MASTLVGRILPIFAIIDVVTSLQPTTSEFIGHVTKEPHQCTVLLLNFEASETQVVSEQTMSPVLILNRMNVFNTDDKFKIMISMRTSKCIIGFAKCKNFNRKLVGELLRFSTYKTLFLFETDDIQSCDDLLDDNGITIQYAATGNLMLKKVSSKNGFITKAIWLSKTQKMANGSIRPLLSQYSATLRGTKVTASLYEIYPYVMFLQNNTFAGAEWDVLNLAAKKIGFEMQGKRDYDWTSRDPTTKRWIGAGGSIINGTAEFGIGTLTMSLRSEDFQSCPIDFSPGMYTTEGVFLTPKPKPLTPFLNFLRPFTWQVWLALIFTNVLCGVVLRGISYFYQDQQLSLFRTIYDLYGIQCSQKLKETLVSPSSGHFYMIFGFWIFVMLIKDCAYTCTLRAAMVKPEFQKPIETDNDIVEQNKDIYISHRTPYEDIYRYSTLSVRKAIYANAVKKKTFSRPFGPVATNNEDRMLEEGGVRMLLNVRATAALKEIEERLGHQPYRASKTRIEGSVNHHVVMKRPNQPWREEFDLLVLNIVEGGFVTHFVRKYEISYIKYTRMPNEEGKLESYRVEHVLGLLILLGVGLLTSLLVFGYEICFGGQKDFVKIPVVTV